MLSYDQHLIFRACRRGLLFQGLDIVFYDASAGVRLAPPVCDRVPGRHNERVREVGRFLLEPVQQKGIVDRTRIAQRRERDGELRLGVKLSWRPCGAGPVPVRKTELYGCVDPVWLEVGVPLGDVERHTLQFLLSRTSAVEVQRLE